MILDPNDLPVPSLLSPGLCSLVDPDLVWLHLISDVATGLAYFSISAALAIFLLRRRDLAFPWVFGLFALFIIACGATHMMHAWTLFRPDYVVEGLIKALTAAISVVTAIALWPLLPRLLALPSHTALAREVEERRSAESRALVSEKRMAAFFANLAEALFVVRVEDRQHFIVETVNPAFERLFGMSAVDLTERRAELIIPPQMLAAALPHWREATASAKTQDYVIESETPAGLRVWQTVLVPLPGTDGTIERLLGSARDITLTRRLQTDLLQSARLATVGTMCAGLAHETSQPLNAALLWLRNARAAAQDQAPEDRNTRLSKAFGIIEGQLRRAGDLVSRIRALPGEGPHSGGAVFDGARTAAAAVRTASSQFLADGIEVSLHEQAARLPVRGTPSSLEQALLQLLANARDAILDRRLLNPDAPAQISVTLRAEAGEALIMVRDSGTGVPDALRDAIFDPFFTTRDPGHGSGLGLPLAAAVARGMGGRIEARNVPGGGALFTMRLASAPDGCLSPVPEATAS